MRAKTDIRFANAPKRLRYVGRTASISHSAHGHWPNAQPLDPFKDSFMDSLILLAISSSIDIPLTEMMRKSPLRLERIVRPSGSTNMESRGASQGWSKARRRKYFKGSS